MNKKWLIVIGVVIIITITSWVAITTFEINKKIEFTLQQSHKNSSEKAKAKNLHIMETESGKLLWELTADMATYANNDAKLTNIKGKFYNKDNKILLTFQAPVGKYIQESHKLSLNKGVLVNHPEAKISIESQTMTWTNKSTDIIATGNVKVVKEGFGVSYADKGTFATDFSKISIEGNTYSEINVSG